MAKAIGEHDVFKLVSLRGSADGLTIDPAGDGIAIPVAHELAAAGVDLARPSAEVLRVAAGWKILTEEELRRLPWADLPGAIKGDLAGSMTSLLTSEIVVGAERMALAIYGAHPEFLAAYGKLADSWMRLRLRRRWKVAGQHEQPLEPVHERLIRVAHIIRRLAQKDPVERGLLLRLAIARIALPQPAARRASSVKPRDPRQGRDARRREIAEAKRTFVRLQTAIADLESIQDKIHGTLSERSGGPEVLEPAILDAAFYAALDSRLTASERSLLDERLGSGPARRPGALADLLAGLEVATVIVSANSLCSRIRVFEDEEKEKLPTAQEPQAGARPSIRALGWGDLIVLRERLIGYDAREIAHIENVLAGEDKAREHERMRRTEELLETETFEQVETERDLQTSERFELQVEAEKTIDSQFAVEAGLNTSGRYGLTRVETSLDVGFQRSIQESQRRSSELAKEVVARSVEKVQRSVRELRRRLTIEELRELNRHSISNTAPDASGAAPAHRVGLYYLIVSVTPGYEDALTSEQDALVGKSATVEEHATALNAVGP